ncbi:MAG: hypothetical protein U9Q37_03070 [Euryarchaeota archaeon]|nr:hypothetical protein [Euryarchaeota archaeon]
MTAMRMNRAQVRAMIASALFAAKSDELQDLPIAYIDRLRKVTATPGRDALIIRTTDGAGFRVVVEAIDEEQIEEMYEAQ